MATYTKIYDYAEQVNVGVHVWGTHTFKMAFSNTAIAQANHNLGAITQISTAGGYTAGAGGGVTLDSVTLTETTGTAKTTIADEVFTATGASVGAMRYFYMYNDSATSPADAGVATWDYGSSFTLLDTETLTFDFDASNGVWQFV